MRTATGRHARNERPVRFRHARPLLPRQRRESPLPQQELTSDQLFPLSSPLTTRFGGGTTSVERLRGCPRPPPCDLPPRRLTGGGESVKRERGPSGEHSFASIVG